MKNFIIALLLLIVVGLGAYIYSLQGNQDSITAFIDQAKSAVTEKIEKIEEQVKEVASKTETVAVQSLPEDTVLSVNFPFQSIKPAVDHLIGTVNKIKNSSLAKKLHLEEMIEQSMQPSQLSEESQMALSDSDSSEFNPPAAAKAISFDEAIKIIQDVASINLLLRAKVVENRSAPMLHLTAKFNSDALNTQIKPSLDMAVEQLNQTMPNSVKSNPSNPDSYNIELKGPMLPVEVVGSVSNKNKELSIKLAALAGQVKEKSQPKADAQNVIANSLLSKDSFNSYFNTDNFIFLQQTVTDAMKSTQGPEGSDSVASSFDAFKALLKNYKSFASSAEFNQGFKSRSCALMTSDSKNLVIAKNAISERAESSNNFTKLIAPRTTAALSFKAASLISYLQSMAPEQTAASSTKDPQLQEATDKILLSVDKLKALGFREFGIVANAPTVSFIPDYGVYIEHNGKHSFKEIADQINQLLKMLAPPSMGLGDALTVTKNVAGKEQVIINVAEYPLVLTAVSDKVILGAGQEAFLQELNGLLSSQTDYISAEKLKSKNISLDLSNNDYQIFFSPSSLTAFARQFLPFLTMSMPDLKVTDAEVNEVLDLLDFNIMLTSASSLPSEDTLCSEGQAILF